MARQGVGLGNAAGVRIASLSQFRIHDVVSVAVGGAPGEFVAHLGERWVGKIVLSAIGLIPAKKV